LNTEAFHKQRLFISQTTLFHTFTMAERPCDWRCWTAGLFLETAMLATDARSMPTRSRGLLGAQTNSPRARQMAARAKSFRGGRPLQPTLCPRCGTPCASAVQAAAHCVGPAVGDRERTAARSQRSIEDLKRDFPRWKYHATEPAVIVEKSSGGSRPR